MGAVYRATDTSLGRQVPIKVLTRSPLILNAVRQWKYEPTVVDGKPAEVVMTIMRNFAFGLRVH